MNEIKDRIGRAVDRTLACFDELETIGPSPFFYDRLERRLENAARDGQAVPARVFSRGLLQPALITCLIIVNVCAAIFLFRSGSSGTADREENLAALAREYGLIQTDTEITKNRG